VGSNTTIALDFSNSGSINVNTGNILNTAGTFSNSGTINVGSGNTFSNTSVMNLNTGTVTAGTGTLTAGGITNINSAVSIAPLFILNVPAGSVITGGSMLTINGTMNWTGGNIESNITVAAGGVITASGATKVLSSILTNNSSINWTAGAINFLGGTLNNNGAINNTFDGNFADAGGSNAFNNSGTFTKTGGTGISSMGIPVINSGSFRGLHEINFASSFVNNGTIDPGMPIGIFTLSNSTSPLLTSGSNLHIELLNGTGAGTGHDQLLMNENLNLDGTLTITETGSVPAGTYTIVNLTSGAITGNFTTINIPAAYSILISSTTVIISKSILSVDLISFSGKQQNEKILLSWKTENEKNNDHFEIQRSMDGKDFSSLGKVYAGRASHPVFQYQYEDYNYKQGRNYYRLKQVDKDGKYLISKAIIVNTVNTSASNTKIFPNPAHQLFVITVPDQWQHADISILNQSGQVVLHFPQVMYPTIQGHLPSGSYYVYFKKGNLKASHKLIVRE
jgi:hypothetical protein